MRIPLQEHGASSRRKKLPGLVPGAQRGEEGFVTGDFRGNRLRRDAKIKREDEGQKMSHRGSRRSC